MGVLKSLLILSLTLFFVVTPVAEDRSYIYVFNDTSATLTVLRKGGFFSFSSETSLLPGHCAWIPREEIERTKIYYDGTDPFRAIICSLGECNNRHIIEKSAVGFLRNFVSYRGSPRIRDICEERS